MFPIVNLEEEAAVRPERVGVKWRTREKERERERERGSVRKGCAATLVRSFVYARMNYDAAHKSPNNT